MSFSLDVSKWAEKTGEEAAEANANVILALFSSVIEDTPVLEGRLRANWIPTKIKPSEATYSTVKDNTPDGAPTIEKVKKFILRQDLQDDFSIYLTNNLPYAHRIEYDGWSHTKAPAGMVRKNLNRIASKI